MGLEKEVNKDLEHLRGVMGKFAKGYELIPSRKKKLTNIGIYSALALACFGSACWQMYNDKKSMAIAQFTGSLVSAYMAGVWTYTRSREK